MKYIKRALIVLAVLIVPHCRLPPGATVLYLLYLLDVFTLHKSSEQRRSP